MVVPFDIPPSVYPCSYCSNSSTVGMVSLFHFQYYSRHNLHKDKLVSGKARIWTQVAWVLEPSSYLAHITLPQQLYITLFCWWNFSTDHIISEYILFPLSPLIIFFHFLFVFIIAIEKIATILMVIHLPFLGLPLILCLIVSCQYI